MLTGFGSEGGLGQTPSVFGPYRVLTFPAYFFLKRSTRPSESTIFCVPVKNGWQLEQMSTLISPTVERVLNFAPQAQLTIAPLYVG